ncbi:hypothetical protein [Paraburkholderia ginsengisoli]|uniref:hypothetical protein n=1 Tax=Paraburkholderia ginsengisoli TaxID=311231 RepID=UPI001C3F41FA|nr:hypothetical protein [Paraburkholderia ginsengisoli]
MNSPPVMVLPLAAGHTARIARFVARGQSGTGIASFTDGKSVKCACYHCVSFILAFGRALKRTNPAALASFAAGITGTGLDGADSSHTGSTSGTGYPSPTVGRTARKLVAALAQNARTSLLPGDLGSRLPRKIECLADKRCKFVRREQKCYT